MSKNQKTLKDMEHEFEDVVSRLIRGDHAPFMACAAHQLNQEKLEYNLEVLKERNKEHIGILRTSRV